MAFIVSFIALMIERFFDCSHLRQWSWYHRLTQIVSQKLTGQSPYLILIVSVLPIVLLLGLFSLLCKGVLYGLVTLLFQCLVLLFCLGPKNLWNDYLSLNTIFVAANRRIFSTIFWFAILGPMGAFLYRAMSLSAQAELMAEPALTQSAKQITALLEWLPARLFTFLFALGGHFSQVLTSWRKNLGGDLNSNETLLTQCGQAALFGDQIVTPEDPSALKTAINLLDRSFIIGLVILAVLMLII